MPGRLAPDTGRTLPVAASTAVEPLLRGPVVEAVVLVTGRFAACLATPVGVVAVVATPAAAPPASLVLPAGIRPDALMGAGEHVLAGAGRLTVGSAGPAPTELRPARWWPPRRVRSGSVDAAVLDDLERGVGQRGRVAEPVRRARTAGGAAARALVAGHWEEAHARLVSVLGLGPGTTPSGDDVAAGVLLAAAALLDGHDQPAVQRLARAVAAGARDRTGCVPASMLSAAQHGQAAAVVVDAVDALAGHRSTADPAAALLALGSTSGADLACGAAAVARALQDSAVRAPVGSR